MFCIVLLWWISSLIHGYWDLSNCWLYCIIIWLNYHVSIFEILGVVATKPHQFYGIASRAPLGKIFRKQPSPSSSSSSWPWPMTIVGFSYGLNFLQNLIWPASSSCSCSLQAWCFLQFSSFQSLVLYHLSTMFVFFLFLSFCRFPLLWFSILGQLMLLLYVQRMLFSFWWSFSATLFLFLQPTVALPHRSTSSLALSYNLQKRTTWHVWRLIVRKVSLHNQNQERSA